MRSALLIFGLTIPGAAMANGAMGLGMEMFDLRSWAAYVVAMVAGEAWLIGRIGLKLGWGESLLRSVMANFFTGMCGGLGCIAPFFHQSFVNTDSGPNPFWNAVVLLAIFAIPSAIIEAFVWAPKLERSRHNSVLLTSLWVHLALVPVGLAILLIPERPYVGMEAWSSGSRRSDFLEIRAGVEAYISNTNAVPKAKTPDELLTELRDYLVRPQKARRGLARVDFSRFSTGQTVASDFEINPKLAGVKITDKGESKAIWYLRPKNSQGWPFGLLVDPSSGETRLSRDMKELGY